jgi:imidazole glycerol-phosphate synthase subunit HisH
MFTRPAHGTYAAQHERSAVIAIIDYNAGNLASVYKAFRCFSNDCVITADPTTIGRAEKIVIPGVGHFSATGALAQSGIDKTIRECNQRKAPLLGICLGLQWLFNGSEEDPDFPGMCLWPGTCTRFPDHVKSPHVGWNQVRISAPSRLLQRIDDGSYFYFTHSYRAPQSEATTAVCQYGESFPAVVEQGNICGVQFHPEKSGTAGLQVVENFCGL